jgi:hypothetical protein
MRPARLRSTTVAASLLICLLGCSGGHTGSGWVGGEPDWSGGHVATGAGGRADSAAAPAGEDAAFAEGEPGTEPAAGPPRAGSVDDNADYQGFLNYLARISTVGVVTRPFDATGRIVVTVTGTDGRPVPGAEVSVSAAGSQVATLRTTADGTARFWPALYGHSDTEYSFTAGESSASAAAGGNAALSVEGPGTRSAPALDIVFLLDATGSMGDEIDQLTATVDSVAGRIAQLPGSPDVRFGLTVYRDEGDAFVTGTYDLTGDLAAFRAALTDVRADGGGDYPEALDEALAEALGTPSWRDPATTTQLVFLVADAPPHVDRQVDQAYPASVVDAVSRGIKVFPIASSESDDQAEAVFRQIAAGTGSRFVFLSYGAGGAAVGANSDISGTDYEELSLDDLVVRLVSEELAAVTGQPAPAPTPTPSPSTPTGQ